MARRVWSHLYNLQMLYIVYKDISTKLFVEKQKYVFQGAVLEDWNYCADYAMLQANLVLA